MRFFLSMVVLFCVVADVSACGNGPARRLVRAEVRLATAPLRAATGAFGRRASSASVGVTVVSGGCPGSGCPLPTAKAAPVPAPVPVPQKK